MEAMIGQVLLYGGSNVISDDTDSFEFVARSQDTDDRADADLALVDYDAGYQELTQQTDNADDTSDVTHTYYAGYVAVNEDG